MRGMKPNKIPLVLALLLGSGCEDDVVQNKPTSTAATAQGATKQAPSRRGRGKPAQTSASDQEAAPPPLEYDEEEFSETARSRDPFRSFQALFQQQSSSTIQARREVILEDYSVDSLKLIGIVSRIRPAKAMLIDPKGQGHVVHRNDYVGKAERVQVGTTDSEYEINWRVDRIRDTDVVLIREDPTNPDVPSATRVIALHVEDGNAR